MFRGVLIVGAALVAACVMASSASAGWAGSVYQKSECTFYPESGWLFCQTHNLVITERRTITLSIDDASCPSGYRSVSRTGKWTRTYLSFYDWYEGPVPKPTYVIGGDDIPGPSYWEPGYKDTNLGCAV